LPVGVIRAKPQWTTADNETAHGWRYATGRPTGRSHGRGAARRDVSAVL